MLLGLQAASQSNETAELICCPIFALEKLGIAGDWVLVGCSSIFRGCIILNASGVDFYTERRCGLGSAFNLVWTGFGDLRKESARLLYFDSVSRRYKV
jgi:hypothetical protein